MKLIISVLCLVNFVWGLQGTPSVIVIGAGPAGIAATARLLENNIEVKLLEAEPRIGGRVHSLHFGDAIIDLGAEWCHGEKDNIVYELVKDLGVLEHSDYHFKFYLSNREEIDDEFSLELHDIFDKLYAPDGDKKQDDEITVGDYFIRAYNASIHERYANDKEKQRVAFAALECMHHYVLSSEGSFSWFDTTATNDYRDCDGDLNLNWQGKGYKTALDVIMKKFPVPDANFPIDDKINVNKEVRKIIWDGKGDGVTVLCSDETIYNADHVIFTPSIGVLKFKQKTLFSPILPKEKVNAIRDIGFGAVMKVMMHFPERWWPNDNFTGFSFVWTPEQKEMLVAEYPHGPSRHGRSWLLEFFGAYRVENNPRVLSLWFTGELVPEIEKITDDVLIDGAIFVFDKFLGHKYKITKPDKIVRSNWFANPHFRGTYSFQTVASRKVQPSSNLILAEPLYNQAGVPVLLFAGETTHPRYYSTVHGAIETGFREADRILKYIHNKE